MGLLCFFFIVSKATIILQKYTPILEFEKKSNKELLGEYNSDSLIECAALCQSSCGFFGYSPQLKKCRLHKKIITPEMADEANWRYYSYHSLPSDCEDLCEAGYRSSDVYQIYPYGTITSPVTVYCDMDTQEGNDVIHQITKERNSSLYISITLVNGTTLYELYDQFSVSNEVENYKIFLAGNVTGSLGDSMVNTGRPDNSDLSGMAFSTFDNDNDKNLNYNGGNCALTNRGGWWFNSCHYAFLNGPWSSSDWKRLWLPTVKSGTDIRILQEKLRVSLRVH
ncbi:fibroleukin-like [Saccostrea cucullata]|uniref:fibroleukin-like n=1 Tax=Saccostrea cuccullata TaxID=36930 RepID=UPI002ED0F173